MLTDACQFFYECNGCGARAWGRPTCAMLAGLFVATPARMVIWIVALAWMGTACILNARRCGQTHCRFTGPYYLAMNLSVLALGEGIVPSGFYACLALGADHGWPVG